MVRMLRGQMAVTAVMVGWAVPLTVLVFRATAVMAALVVRRAMQVMAVLAAVVAKAGPGQRAALLFIARTG